MIGSVPEKPSSAPQRDFWLIAKAHSCCVASNIECCVKFDKNAQCVTESEDIKNPLLFLHQCALTMLRLQ